MVITFTLILFGLAALIPPLRYNKFYLLNGAVIVGAAYFTENHYFTAPPFMYKTFLLFIVYHLFCINIVTFIAYGIDKRAAKRGAWRISERDLHMLEFLGGWIGAWIAQKFFNHKTNKKSYQHMYKLMIIMEFAAVWFILKFLKLI